MSVPLLELLVEVRMGSGGTGEAFRGDESLRKKEEVDADKKGEAEDDDA